MVHELCFFTNGRIADFFVSILYKLKFASTKFYETYTQYLLPKNSDQVQIWVASLLPFFSYVLL